MRRMTGKKPSGPAGHLKAAVGTVAERLNLNPQATLRKGFNNIVEVQPRTGEEQAPSRVAERLIINQQAGAQTQPPSPALRRQRTSRRLWRQASSGRFSRSGPENGANGLPKRDEVARGLGLLVLERDGALAVVRLDAVVAEAGMVPALDHDAPRRPGEHPEHVLHEPAPVP